MPGGFGERGTEGKIMAAKFAREHKIPYLGICLGMQTAVMDPPEYGWISNAGSEEFDHEAGKRRFEPIIYHLKSGSRKSKVSRNVEDDKGGTMRLGHILPYWLKVQMLQKYTTRLI